MYSKDKQKPQSLSALIRIAVEMGELHSARKLIACGLQRFPDSSYYNFLTSHFEILVRDASKKYDLFMASNEDDEIINNGFLKSWALEVNSNHIIKNNSTNKTVVRDSDYIIIHSTAATTDYVDGRQVITLTPAASGWIFHGPYRPLEIGNYKLLIEFELDNVLTAVESPKFVCKYDITNNSEEIIYSVDSQTIIKNCQSDRKNISYTADIRIDTWIENLVIRGFVEIPGAVKLFLPQLSMNNFSSSTDL
jgi:hypothetical protein